MKQLFLFITILVLNGFLSEKACAQEVSVILTTDESFSNRAIIDKMQRNLSQVLTEINRAQKENRLLNTIGLALDDFADRSLHMLWANIHFYCDDEEVVERCWVFGDGEEYMVSHIPLIIQMEGEEFGNGTYQEAVVDFDRQGRIKDFRFSLDAQLGESMEHCGVAEVEKRMKIRAYCERLQTAYNQKDIDFINQIFSDDALIITGTVVSVKPMEDRYANKLKVVYKKQNKEQYIANLKKAFLRNKWIDVKLSDIEENGNLPNACAGVTRSKINPNMFGVRLRQEWRSSNYSDVGYLFLLWDFTDEDKPVIHVRTWQPEFVGNVRQEPDVNISTLGAFDL